MLRMVIGRAGSGKTNFCLNTMKTYLVERGLSARIFLLMPAYMTYQTEKELAIMTKGQTNTYTFSLERFSKQILIEVGGANVPKVDELGRRMILRKILIRRDKSQDLRYFARMIKRRGFGETLSDTIKELRTYEISSDKLREVVEDIDNDELFDKALDLAMITEDFRREIDGKHYDDEDLIELATAQLKNSQLCRDAEFFIDGFVFFNPIQRKLVREILKYARNVTITLTMATDLNDKDNDEEVGLFRQSMKTFKTIRQLCLESKVDFEIIRCNENQRLKSDSLKILESNLFSFAKKILPNNNEVTGVKIIEAASSGAEVEAVAKDILKLKNECNYKFRDIGILIRGVNYYSYLKSAFERNGIPYFSNEERKAIHHPLIDFILCSIEILTATHADVLFYCLRTGFFDLALDEIDLLENYVLEFGIKGMKSWKKEQNWNYYRKIFDREEISSSTKKNLQKVNELKDKIIDYYASYLKTVNKKSTVREMSEALYGLLESVEVPQTLDKWSKEALERGDLVNSKVHLTIWNEVIKMLEQLVEINGEEIIPLKEYETIVNEGLEAINISLIPQGLDEVSIAEVNQNSLQNVKAIYILGVNEGQMPGMSKEKNLFSDAERFYLNEAGLEVHSGKVENSLAEKFLLYRAFTEPREYLCLSYPLADKKSDSLKRSPIIDKIKNILPEVKIEFVGLDILNNNSDVRYQLKDKTISPIIAMKLFSSNRKTIRSSVSKIEMFMSCQFKHFAKYGLKLEKRKEYKFNSMELGNLLHLTMSKFGERMKAENRRWSNVSYKEVDKIVDEIFDEIVPETMNKILMSNAMYQHQLERIKESARRSIWRLVKFDDDSHFKPEEFEVGFGMPDNPLTFDLNDGLKIDLAGRIDRVDYSEDGKYFMIMDYKSGNAYINLIDVFCGLNLQLLTYLFLVYERFNAKKLPAAMLYCFLKYPATTEKIKMNEEEAREAIEKSLKMPGWILADSKVIRDIDKNQKFIKVKLKNDGGINLNSKKYVKTKEEFDTLLRYVKRTFQLAGQRIINGDISVKPYKEDSNHKSACNFCDYSSVCCFEQSFVKQNWREEPKFTDEQIIKEMNKKLQEPF